MRRDKISMKSILENARAMRTASLSGKKGNSNSLFPQPKISSREHSPEIIQSQSQIMGRSNHMNPYRNLSQQFSQEILPNMVSYNSHFQPSPNFSNRNTNPYQNYQQNSMEQTNQLQNCPITSITLVREFNQEIRRLGYKDSKIPALKCRVEDKLKLLRHEKVKNWRQLLENLIV